MREKTVVGRFVEMPWWVKLTVGLTMLNTWVLFEETIVDRHDLARYLPAYRVGQPCAWDLGVTLAIVLGLTWGARRLSRRRAA